MAISDRTKLLLSEQLKEASKSTPLSKIKVSELCAACGIDRRTFYYHFRDIYDLTAWIFINDVDKFLPGRSAGADMPGLAGALSRIQEYAYFYRRALSEDSQNSLGRFILHHSQEFYERELKLSLEIMELTAEDRFAVRFYCFGILGMIRGWLFSDCTPPPAQMADLLIYSMPQTMRRLIEYNGGK